MRPSPERSVIERQASRPIVGLVVDRADWHGRELAAALAARGVATVPRSPGVVRIYDPERRRTAHRWFWGSLPDAVVVRSMSGGTFRSRHTPAWAFSTHCGSAGSSVWNDARAIERCVDKSMTSFLLARAGIADAGDLGGGIIRAGTGHCATRNNGWAVGAQAAVWIAGTRAEVDPQAGRSAADPAKWPAGYTICNALWPSSATVSTIFVCSSRKVA